MGRKDADGVPAGHNIGCNKTLSRLKAEGSRVFPDERVDDGEPGKNGDAKLVQAGPGVVAGKIRVRVIQLGPDVSNVRFQSVAGQRLIKLLKAENISLLAADKIHHFRPVSCWSSLVEESIEAAYVPCKDAEAAGRFAGGEVVARMQRQKAVDIRPAYQQGDERQQGPAAKGPDEQRHEEKDDDEQ